MLRTQVRQLKYNLYIFTKTQVIKKEIITKLQCLNLKKIINQRSAFQLEEKAVEVDTGVGKLSHNQK